MIRRPLSPRAVGRRGLSLCCFSLLAIAAPRFLPSRSAPSFRGQQRPVLVAAVGMTLVILCRQIDISIGSIFSICGVVAGLLAQAGLPIALVGLGTLVAGGGLGCDQWCAGRADSACRQSWSPWPRW